MTNKVVKKNTNANISNEPEISEEMAVKFGGLKQEIIKVGVITAALIVVLIIAWLIFK